MANEFIIRKGYKSLSDSQITGSLTVSNSVTASFFTGSFRGDGSELTGIDGFPFTGSASISGSLTVVGPVTATEFIGNGSQLTGIDGFPFTGSAAISGSLTVDGNVIADSFTGSIQGTATTASYVNIANVDGFTAYSSSVNTAIGSVLDATTPITATINNTNSPFTITNQTIVIVDSTNGNVTVNLPDLDTVVGTPNQRPIIIYKNDYSQNVVYVQPNGSELVNGSSQDIIVSIQLAVIYNPTSAGWVTEGTSAQSLAELELFFVPRTETGSLSVATASYVEYTDVVNKPTLVSGSSQISFSGITNKPTLVSGSSQITYSGLTGKPSGIVSSSVQVKEYNVFATTGSNQFNGNQSITGSLTVSGQVVAQTLNVQQVTSSIVYSSGSNIFGNSVSNVQQFTGSLQVSGSSHYLLGNVGIGKASPSFKVDIVGSDNSQLRLDSSDTVDTTIIMDYNGGGATNRVRIRNAAGALAFNTANSAERMRLDSSGNLGLGVTPNTWTGTGVKAFQFQNGSLAASLTFGALFGWNTYYNGSYRYVINGTASAFLAAGNEFIWYQAPSGTAGNAISFTQAMTLDASGRLGIGVTSPSSILEVRGSTSSPQFRISRSEQTNQGLTVQAGGGVTVFDSYDGTDTVFGSYTFNSTKGSTTSTRMRIDGSGNVGIGIDSPANKLQVNVSSNTTSLYNDSSYPLLIKNTSTTDNSYVGMYFGTGLGVGVTIQALYTNASTRSEGNLLFSTRDSGGSLAERMRITSGGVAVVGHTAGVGTNFSPPIQVKGGAGIGNGFGIISGFNEMVGGIQLASSSTNSLNIAADPDNLRASTEIGFIIDGTTRMRITSDGKVIVGASYMTYPVSIEAQSGGGQLALTRSGAVAEFYMGGTTGGTTQLYVRSGGSGGVRLDAGSTGWVADSDIRLKDIEKPIENAVESLSTLQTVYYSWKDSENEKQHLGLIAQEVEAIFPELVSESSITGMKGVNYMELIPVLIKAIQEQQSQIEILKAEIQTLKQ